MNKSQLIDVVSKDAGLKRKDAEAAVNSVISAIETALAEGEKVQLVGFGTFDVKRKGPRPGRNPKKPEVEITIPAANVPYFKPGKYLKESLNSSEAE